jgi:hypothetical protein
MIDAGIGANSASGGYDIDNSVKLEADNTEYFSRTPSSNSNRQNFTFSTWVKRTELGQNARLIDAYQDGQNFFTLGFDTSDRLVLYNIDSSVDYGGHYSQRFRDTSAWYHIVFRSETTSGTATTRWKLYVNGVEITAKDTDYGTPPRWYQSNLNSTISHKVGYNTDGSNGSSQYMAETHLVDGTSLLPTSFGEFDEDSGIWKPIEVEDVTYGTNGFYLDYTDGSDLGNDANGSNNFAENNITAIDQATDTPTNNFCTMNNLSRTNGNIRSQEGGTQVTTDGGSGWCSMNATMGVQTGKWYWEVRFENNGDADTVMIGMAASDDDYIPHKSGGYYLGNVSATGSHGWYFVNGGVYNLTGTWTGPSLGDMAMVALDCDNGKIYFGVNGTWRNSSNPATNTNGADYVAYQSGRTQQLQDSFMIPSVSVYQGHRIKWMNFGGHTQNPISSAESDANGYGTFEYAPPSGFYSLCTKNLAEFG